MSSSNGPASAAALGATAAVIAAQGAALNQSTGGAKLGPRGLPLYVLRSQGDFDALARTEWLLTAGNGGFAMGTASGTPSRRYHGYLIASMRPPVARILALSSIAENLIVEPDTPGAQQYDLSCYRFRPGELHPRGDQYLVRFEKDVSVRWIYRAGRTEVVKELSLVRGAPAVIVKYTVRMVEGAGGDGPRAMRLVLHPLVAMRDFHSLALRDTARDRVGVKYQPRAMVIGSPEGDLHITASAGQVISEETWWYNFQYDLERDRGYDYLEDLYHPGSFTIDFDQATIAAGKAEVTIVASMNQAMSREMGQQTGEAAERLTAILEKARSAVGGAGPHNDAFSALVAASDDFIVKRLPVAAPAGGAATAPKPGAKVDEPVTVIAGYPWFVDWGRDSMISLPGLLLATGRHDEARRLLATFAAHTKDGLVPNVFDDYTGQPHYNTVDASLWFIHACCEYLRATQDKSTFVRDLLPACLNIVHAYQHGAPFHIRMDDADGLIMAGDHTTQLTWMDAKRDGVVFTPRHGKPVEINALWHHALGSLVEAAGGERPALKRDLGDLQMRVARSFVARFWDPERKCLNDVLLPHGTQWEPNRQVRPNQIFAVSLRHSPLDAAQKHAVVNIVGERLYTKLGLRTLDPADPGYVGRYRGRMFERDAAYHNGTAWPWLLGPYAEAVLRAGEFSTEARVQARAVLSPLIARLDVDCPGQLAEVFDGDGSREDPQRPGGCPAQAWSIAEALRVMAMVIKAERGVKGL